MTQLNHALIPIQTWDAVIPDLNPATEAGRIAAAAAGSEAAFIELMQAYRPLLSRLAWQIARDADDAQDICQEVLIRTWKALPKYRPEQAFGGWLRTLAIREGLRWLKRNRPHRQGVRFELAEAQVLEIADGRKNRLDALLAQEHRGAIEAALDRLTPRQRAAVVLRYFEEMPLAEIGEALECSAGSVKQHLFRAMSKLRKIVKRERD